MDYFVSVSFPLSLLIRALGHRQNVTSFEISILYPPEVEMAVWKQKQRKNIEISKLNMFNHSVVSDSVSPWTVVHQAPLSTGILQARMQEWITISSSRGSFWSRDWIQVSHIAGGFFTIWATREAKLNLHFDLSQKMWYNVWCMYGSFSQVLTIHHSNLGNCFTYGFPGPTLIETSGHKLVAKKVFCSKASQDILLFKSTRNNRKAC